LRASSFTGGGVKCFPLPLGLSGWVTTAIISSPDVINALRDGTAKSGVP